MNTALVGPRIVFAEIKELAAKAGIKWVGQWLTLHLGQVATAIAVFDMSLLSHIMLARDAAMLVNTRILDNSRLLGLRVPGAAAR